MKRCYFCEDLQRLYDQDRLTLRNHPELDARYKVCLVREVWGIDGRLRGTGTYKARRLKYCPCCGRPISRKGERSGR